MYAYKNRKHDHLFYNRQNDLLTAYEEVFGGPDMARKAMMESLGIKDKLQLNLA